MSWRHDAITDLDLMAYADDQLDTVRRQLVEAHLAANPHDALMVEAIIEQNTELRASLAAIADEPVPERLKAVLEREPRRLGRPALRAAAVAGLAVTSGLGGWWVGQNEDQPRTAPPAFLSALAPSLEADELTAIDAAEIVSTPAAEAVEMPAPWLTEEVLLKLVAPSLGGVFSSPELQRLYDLDGRPTVRFALEGPEGRPLSLFLQTRPPTTPPAVQLVERGSGTSTVPAAYWQDGPLVWALTGETTNGELEALAQTIATAVELEFSLGSIEAELTRNRGETAGIQVTAGDSEVLPTPLVLPESRLLPLPTTLPIELAGG